MTELFLLVVIKASVLLAFGLAAARAAARAQASVRHLWLAATLAAIAVLPLVSLTAPGVTIPVPATFAARIPLIGGAVLPPEGGQHRTEGSGSAGSDASVASALRRNTTANSASAGTGWPGLLGLTWTAGVAAYLAALIVSFARVRRIRRDGVPLPGLRALAGTLAGEAGIGRTVEVLEHEAIAAPFTCGLWRPAIVLPCDARSWDEADLRRAIVHELEHVRRHDWAVQLAARAVCAGYWFHPLAWAAWRGLCLEAERACDDAVVKAADRTDYADQLVLLARRLSSAPPRAMLGMANRGDLSARVTALLDEGQRRGRAGAFAAAGALAASALVVAAIAPVRAVAASEIPDVTDHRATFQAEGKPRRSGPLDRAIYEAAEEGDLDVIDRLLQAGANVNAAVDGDGSPLIAAARGGRLAVVKHLLDRGADPNMPVSGDGAPLLAAAEKGKTEVVSLLLQRGANIELVVPGDENALIQASGSGRLEVVRLLVASGANVNARIWVEVSYPTLKGEWRTALSVARRERHDAVVAFLLASGARE